MVVAALLILSAVTVVALKQRNNIVAVYKAVTTDNEELAREMGLVLENRQQELAKKGVTVIPPSQQDLEDLLRRKKTPEEVFPSDGQISELEDLPETDQSQSGTNTDASENTGLTAGQTNASQKTDSSKTGVYSETDLYNECVAALYSYEAQLYGLLGELYQSGLSRWESLDASERTAGMKRSIANDTLDQCYDYEVMADNQVISILDLYRAKLTEIGGDTSVMDMLWKSYCAEKDAAKAYYINQYL